LVPLKIVSNVSRFKPALNLNRVLADLNCGSNSLNSISGLSNAVGQDMTTNTGRKERSLDARVKFVIDAFDSMPRADYVSTLAQDIQTFDQ